MPITVENENFEPAVKEHFAFAVEKLAELKELAAIYEGSAKEKLRANQELFAKQRVQRMLNYMSKLQT